MGRWVVAPIFGIEYVCIVLELAGMWTRVRITGSPKEHYGYWLSHMELQPWKGRSRNDR